MKLETLRNNLFAITTTEAAALVGGAMASDTFEDQDTFYLDGSVRTDKAQID